MQAKYTVLDRLGGGGQAEVFRGISESIQGYKKAVAIKRVLPHLTTNERFVAMFLDEARLSLFLQHANVVQVFAVSRADDGTYFLVMEFGDGCDLKELVAYHRAHRASDIGLALYIMAEAARGLHYAHTLDHPYTGKPLGIVHRDVSPPNIMLSKNGEVMVVADEPYATVQKVREARIPSLPAISPNVAPELDAIVRKALAKNRDDRYPTAAEYGEPLADFMFANELKATSRDLAAAVREVKVARERAANPMESLIHALVMDELARMMSIIEDEVVAKPAELTPAEEIVDTTDWTKNLLDD